MTEKHKREFESRNELRGLELFIVVILFLIAGMLCIITVMQFKGEDLSIFISQQQLFSNLYEYCVLVNLAESQEGCEEMALGASNYIVYEKWKGIQ